MANLVRCSPNEHEPLSSIMSIHVKIGAWCCAPLIPERGGRDRRIPGAHWAASGAKDQRDAVLRNLV